MERQWRIQRVQEVLVAKGGRYSLVSTRSRCCNRSRCHNRSSSHCRRRSRRSRSHRPQAATTRLSCARRSSWRAASAPNATCSSEGRCCAALDPSWLARCLHACLPPISSRSCLGASVCLSLACCCCSCRCRGPPKSTRDDPHFLDSYHRASRLHFIGARGSPLALSLAASPACLPDHLPCVPACRQLEEPHPVADGAQRRLCCRQQSLSAHPGAACPGPPACHHPPGHGAGGAAVVLRGCFSVHCRVRLCSSAACLYCQGPLNGSVTLWDAGRILCFGGHPGQPRLPGQAAGAPPLAASSPRALLSLPGCCCCKNPRHTLLHCLHCLQAVCHSASAKGTAEVSACNYEARRFGIAAGMTIGCGRLPVDCALVLLLDCIAHCCDGMSAYAPSTLPSSLKL